MPSFRAILYLHMLFSFLFFLLRSTSLFILFSFYLTLRMLNLRKPKKKKEVYEQQNNNNRDGFHT